MEQHEQNTCLNSLYEYKSLMVDHANVYVLIISAIHLRKSGDQVKLIHYSFFKIISIITVIYV